MRRSILLLIFFQARLAGNAQQQDTLFWQEYHEAYPLPAKSTDKNTRSIAIDSRSTIWIATSQGILSKKLGTQTWSPLTMSDADKGPAYAVLADTSAASPAGVWIGAWNGLFFYSENRLLHVPAIQGPISALCRSTQGIYALGPKGAWLVNGATAIKKNYPIPRSVRQALADRQDGIWIASDAGVYHAGDKGTQYYQGSETLISAGAKALSFDTDNRLWIAGLGGISILRDGIKQKFLTPKEGCPSIYTTCIRQAQDGAMWVGTKNGIVRFYPDGSHSLRFSRRWLMDDEVNDIAFDNNGNAWIATKQGVSAIMRKKMNLAAKQDYFYDVLMKRHIRAPWIAGQCHLNIPGDTASFQPEDDDNDGEYTGNYLAMESFRFAVTQDEDARTKAAKAFHFLAQLEEVTGGDGYFARTIVPAEWASRVHDNNRKYTPRDIAEEEVLDPRYKPVEIRWRRSADGKWLWKGDASSDEWCGHMLGYFFYYQLAANETERSLVRKHVARLADHLIAHDFYMMDIDGTHTHWAVWSPASLNNDPEWNPDRAQNSMELLSFLKLAAYMTGDSVYQQHYRRLIEKDHYLDNMAAIARQDPAWFIYFDVTMQAYLYPILLHCEKDPALLAFYRQHIDDFIQRRRADHNPQIDFLYAYARNEKIDAAADIDFLTDTPLDLIDWHIDHTKREDIQLVHTPVLDDLQVDQLPPASIRQTVRWDKNPWTASGGNPDMEREPLFWLLPYWMGRYLQIIHQ